MVCHLTINGMPLCEYHSTAIATWDEANHKHVTCGHATKEHAERALMKLIELNPDREPKTMQVVEGMCPAAFQTY